jgi:hypothetical protein
MNGWLSSAACAGVRAWTWLYTLPLERGARRARQAEIESDLWDFRHDDAYADGDFATAVHILVGALLAMPDDVLWICDRRPRHARRPHLSLVLRCAIVGGAASSLVVSASGPAVDVASVVRVNVVSAGWMPVAASGTGSTLAPALAFTLTNTGERPTGALQVNAVFYSAGARRTGMGAAFSPIVGWRGLTPGATSGGIVVRGQGQLLVDTTTLTPHAPPASLGVGESRVALLVQHEGNWTRLADFPIPPRVTQP